MIISTYIKMTKKENNRLPDDILKSRSLGDGVGTVWVRAFCTKPVKLANCLSMCSTRNL